MILLYTTFGSNDSKQARTFLIEEKKVFAEKNIKRVMLSKQEITYLLTRCKNGTDDLLSKRSLAYKEIKTSINDMTTNELVHYIQQQPTILKLPLMVNESMLLTGWRYQVMKLAHRL